MCIKTTTSAHVCSSMKMLVAKLAQMGNINLAKSDAMPIWPLVAIALQENWD